MIVTTTQSVEGRPVREYLGIINAQSIIGVDLDFETIGGSGSMLMVIASETAVRV